MLQFTFRFTCKFIYIFTFTFTSKLLIALIPFILHDMIFTQTKTLDFMVELPLGVARGQNGDGAKETAIRTKGGHLCTLDTSGYLKSCDICLFSP